MKQIIPILPKFQFGNPNHCTYCGDTPSGMDHVIPVVYQHTQDQSRFESNGPTTWACHSCNGQLSSNWFDDFDGRCRWITDRLDTTVKPIHWASYELTHLDYGLRKFIGSENARRRWQRARADWYESRDYWLNLENLQWKLAEFHPGNPGLKFLNGYFSKTLQLLKELIYA